MEPSGVVRIGNLKRLSVPLRNLIVHMIESRAAQRLHGAAQGHDVRVVAHLDGVLRADLHAGVALPALLGLLVEGLHRMPGLRSVLVEQHQVVRADVHAGGLVLPLAAVALVGTTKVGMVTASLFDFVETACAPALSGPNAPRASLPPFLLGQPRVVLAQDLEHFRPAEFRRHRGCLRRATCAAWCPRRSSRSASPWGQVRAEAMPPHR